VTVSRPYLVTYGYWHIWRVQVRCNEEVEGMAKMLAVEGSRQGTNIIFLTISQKHTQSWTGRGWQVCGRFGQRRAVDGQSGQESDEEWIKKWIKESDEQRARHMK
jgi:hypothetical protein